MKYPDFIIIGAAKAATTSLHTYLAQHPALFLSEPKEPEVFAHEADPARIGQRYAELFQGARDDQLCGESSTIYTRYPQVPDVPERIARACPGVKLIYLMRSPIARAYSYYHQALWTYTNIHRVSEPRVSFEEYLDRWSTAPVDSSDYPRQIERYLRHFDREQMLFLKFEDLGRDPEALLEATTRFLGVADRASWSRTAANTQSDRDEQRRRKEASRLVRQAPGANLLRRALPGAIRERVSTLVYEKLTRRVADRRITRPPMQPATRERLAKRYRPMLEPLEQLTGLSLDDWRRDLRDSDEAGKGHEEKEAKAPG